MSLVYEDRVKETTATTGTGTFDLDGAAVGFRGFVEAVGTAKDVPYGIWLVGTSEWEIGIGTVIAGSPDTLTRDHVLRSSNAGALVNFSAGDKDIFLPEPALSRSERGYIDGFITQNNATDSDHDIDFGEGWGRDDLNQIDIITTVTIIKQLDAAFAEGSNQGGLDTGAIAADTWYHMHAITKPNSDSDFLFSLSATAPTLPSGFTHSRRVGSVLTNGSSNIIAYRQTGNIFYWVESALDLSIASPGTDPDTLFVVSAPLGVETKAIVRLSGSNSGGSGGQFGVGHGSMATPPSIFDYFTLLVTIGSSTFSKETLGVETNTSSQLRFRTVSMGTSIALRTLGYIDPRGSAGVVSGGSVTSGGAELPQGYVNGLITSNNAVDALRDIDVDIGVIRDDTDVDSIELLAPLVGKQLDALWAPGGSAGGLDTGTIAATEKYDMFLIKRSDSGVVDMIFAISGNAPILPANYDLKQVIGGVITDGSSNIRPYTQTGASFRFDDLLTNDVDLTNPAASPTLGTLSTPRRRVRAVTRVDITNDSAGTDVFVGDPTLPVPTFKAGYEYRVSARGSNNTSSDTVEVFTNKTSQVRFEPTTATIDIVRILGLGWNDPRGASAIGNFSGGGKSVHATEHSPGGSDEITVENLGTDELDAAKDFKVDESGGLFWRNPTGTGTGTYNFSTTTTEIGIVAGETRLNAATQQDSTFAFISKTTLTGKQVGNILLLLKNGDFYDLNELADLSRFQHFQVTGTATDETTHIKIPIISTVFNSALRNNRTVDVEAFIGAGEASTLAVTLAKEINVGANRTLRLFVFMSSVVPAAWKTFTGGGGASVNTVGEDGGAMRLMSGSGGQKCDAKNEPSTGNGFLSLGKKISQSVRAKLGAATQVLAKIGLYTGASTDILEFFTDDASTFWKIRTTKAGVEQITVTTVAKDVSYHIFTIAALSTTSVEFSIDNVVVFTQTDTDFIPIVRLDQRLEMVSSDGSLSLDVRAVAIITDV